MPAPSRKPLHPRNPHLGLYDFPVLVRANPGLAVHVRKGPLGQDTIDFSDPVAVKALNQALLVHFYGLAWWDIPDGFLCPPVPGRADYIHSLADLWAESSLGLRSGTKGLRVLDIGVGANCIYPIIGSHAYGWRFVGSESHPASLLAAQVIIDANPQLGTSVELRSQEDSRRIFEGVIRPGEHFELSLCNPPFHASAQEAMLSNRQRLDKQGLSQKTGAALNFGGQATELWCEGGEAAFLRRMVAESRDFASQVDWFSCLVSSRDRLPALYKQLRQLRATEVRTIAMAQGQKQTRLVAWCYRRDPERPAHQIPGM